MKKIFLCLVFGILLISFVSSVSICVDKTSPSAPASLSTIASGNNIILNWGAAIDEPSCSGIDYYLISRNGEEIGNTTSLTFTDSGISYGNYNYTISAFDKVGHNQGSSIKIEIQVSESNSGGGSSGGGGGSVSVIGGESTNSYICSEDWQCGEWSDCKNGIQTRTCTDSNSCGTSNGKPSTEQQCETTTSTNLLTGFAVGVSDFAKSPAGVATFVIVGLFAVGGVTFLAIKGKFKNFLPKKKENSIAEQ
jgi:hypothetical protein